MNSTATSSSNSLLFLLQAHQNTLRPHSYTSSAYAQPCTKLFDCNIAFPPPATPWSLTVILSYAHPHPPTHPPTRWSAGQDAAREPALQLPQRHRLLHHPGSRRGDPGAAQPGSISGSAGGRASQALMSALAQSSSCADRQRQQRWGRMRQPGADSSTGSFSQRPSRLQRACCSPQSAVLSCITEMLCEMCALI